MRARRNMVWGASAWAAVTIVGLVPAAARADGGPGPQAHFGPAGGLVAPPLPAVAATSTATAPAATSAVKGMTIEPIWDASVTSSSRSDQVEKAFTEAAAFFESQYSDPITVKINVGFGEVYGSSLGSGTLGASMSYLEGTSYDTLRSALLASAAMPDQLTAAADLPATSPSSGGAWWTTAAEAMSLGLMSGASYYANAGTVAGFVGLSSTLPMDFTDATPTSGSYDPVGVFEHEISEVLGRMALAGSTVGGVADSFAPDDLFRYTAPGTHTLSPGDAYLSADGGVTSLVQLNGHSGGDVGDYADTNADAFNAFTNAGEPDPVTTAGLANLDVLGYHRLPDRFAVTPSVTTTRPGAFVTITAAATYPDSGPVDVTNRTTFTITNETTGSAHGASCQLNQCLVAAPGNYTVTGTYLGVSGSATVAVQP